MRPARATAGIAMLVVAASTTLTACEDSTPVVRGFDSRQLLAMREPTLRFSRAGGYTDFTSHVTYTTGDAAAGDAIRYWSVDVRTGDIREHDQLFTGVTSPPTDGSGRFTCTWDITSGQAVQVITDTHTGHQAMITDVYLEAGGPYCPTEADPTLTVWRFAGGRVALWTGPFDAIAPAPLDQDLVVWQVLSFRDVSNVIAAPAGQPAALGIYSIDLTTFAVTTVVPATLAGGAWARGVAAMGDLESSSLFVPQLVSGGDVVTSAFGDRFIYSRAMSDGSAVMFVGPYPDGPAREVALFRKTPTTTTKTTRIPIIGTGALRMAWSESEATTVTLRLYDDARRQVTSCVLLNTLDLRGVTSVDGDDVLFSPAPFDADLHKAHGPVVMMTPAADGSGGCTVFAEADALAAGRSPDDAWLYWLMDTFESADTQLWIAARDGSGRRLLGTDDIAGTPAAPRFVGDNQLQFKLGRDLTWLDVRDDPVRMHYITENVFGTAIDVGRWLVTGRAYSDQDATGRLAVVNRDTGETLPISPEVERYASPDHGATRPLPADRAVHVVYVVRGRNPSPQDGLWLATIDGAALLSR